MSRDDLNVSVLGQVFTPKRIVSDMISLIRNHGNILDIKTPRLIQFNFSSTDFAA